MNAAKPAPPIWVRALASEIRAWVLETFSTRADVAALERKVLESKAGGASPAELEAIAARLDTIEARLSAEARDWARGALIDVFRGTFDDHTRYAAGELTVYSGSLWLCVRDSDGARPGKSDCWRVVARAGKDARGER